TFITIVMNQGGNFAGTVWTYTATINPNTSNSTAVVTSSYRGTTYVGTSTTNDPGNVNEFFSGGSNTPLPGGILTVATDQALGNAGVGEQQNLTVSGSTSGNFTLSFNGQPTGSLPATATATDIANALNGLSTIGGIGGTVEVVKDGGIFTITFGGTL